MTPPADVWVEFNDIDPRGRTTTYDDLAEPGVDLSLGASVVAGDHEGNRVLATVAGLHRGLGGPSRVDLQLHLESFIPAD